MKDANITLSVIVKLNSIFLTEKKKKIVTFRVQSAVYFFGVCSIFSKLLNASRGNLPVLMKKKIVFVQSAVSHSAVYKYTYFRNSGNLHVARSMMGCVKAVCSGHEE